MSRPLNNLDGAEGGYPHFNTSARSLRRKQLKGVAHRNSQFVAVSQYIVRSGQVVGERGAPDVLGDALMGHPPTLTIWPV